MKTLQFIILSIALISIQGLNAQKDYNNVNFSITNVTVQHHSNLQLTSWHITVKGVAGATTPQIMGQLDGAHVLGYVFPTSLKATDVGFNATDGIVALALTSHPDFDDTPLWDENADRNYANDGVIWHPHWVILVPDDRVAGGLAVKQFTDNDTAVVLPPTNPGMPMYMDSPGYQVVTSGNNITVVIPTAFVNGRTDFKFDAVAARMQVNTSNADLPLLGVYEVYEILSGDLSLPYTIQ